MVAMFTKKMAVLNMTQSVAPLRHDRKQQNEHARPQIPVLGAWSFNEASFLYLCWSHDVGHRYPQGSSHCWKTEPPTHWVLVQVSDLFQHDLLDSSVHTGPGPSKLFRFDHRFFYRLCMNSCSLITGFWQRVCRQHNRPPTSSDPKNLRRLWRFDFGWDSYKKCHEDFFLGLTPLHMRKP